MNTYTCEDCGRVGWKGQSSYFDHWCWWTKVMRWFNLKASGAGEPGPKPGSKPDAHE